MITDLAEYTTADLEALENEHPEWGRLEVLDGALHATGGSAVGDLHQLVMQRLHLLFAPLCPSTHLGRIDAWRHFPRGKLRPDLAVYRAEDRPPDREAFRAPPWAVVEILSDDADHDLVRKDGIYAEFGVEHRAYVEPWGRYDWWCRLDSVQHDQPAATWALETWPPVDFERAALLAD